MKCDEAYRLIIDYLAGELDDSSAAALMEHLADCEECSREFETLKHDWELTAKAFSPASKPPTVLTDAHKEKIYREISEKKSEKNILPFSKEPGNKTIQFPKHLARIAALLVLSVFLGFMIIPMMKKDATHQVNMTQQIVDDNSIYEDRDNEQLEHDASVRPTAGYSRTDSSAVEPEDLQEIFSSNKKTVDFGLGAGIMEATTPSTAGNEKPRELPVVSDKEIGDFRIRSGLAEATTPSAADKEKHRELSTTFDERISRINLLINEIETNLNHTVDMSEAHASSIAQTAPGGVESEARAKTRVISFFEEIPQEKRERSSHETARSNSSYFSTLPTYSSPPGAQYNARLAVLDEIQPRTNEMIGSNFAPLSSVQNAYIIVKEENAKKDKLMPDSWSSKKGGLQPKADADTLGTEKVSEIRKEEDAEKSIRADAKSNAPVAAEPGSDVGDMQTLSFVLNDAKGSSITQKKVEVPLLDLDANNAPVITHQMLHFESNETVKKKIDWSNSVNTYLTKRTKIPLMHGGRLVDGNSFFNNEDTQIVLSVPDNLSSAGKQPGIFSFIVKSPFDLPDEYFIFVALIPDKNDSREILDFDLNLFPSNSNIRMIQVQKTDLGNENMTLLTSFPQEMLSDPENALAVILAKMDGKIGQPVILQADAVTGMISEAPPIVRLAVVNTFFNSKYRLNDKNINTLRNLTEDLLKTAYPGDEKLQKLKESLDQSVRKQ